MAAPNTPRAKTERLMNLTMSLLQTRRPLPKQKIRGLVEAYQLAESDEAFDRMFERDKDELRDLGIPLVVEEVDSFFGDEPGYRIDRRDYALPDLSFAADELAVIGLASRAWTQETMAGSAATAWRKVAAAGTETEDGFAGLQPRIGGGEVAFDPLKGAVVAARSVTFTYTKAGEEQGTTRRVDPWTLTCWRGRWYLVGHDLDRQAPRIFRLSRITSEITLGGPIQTPMPEGTDPVTVIQQAQGGGTRGEGGGVATLLVRPDRGHALRRRARPIEAATDEHAGPDERDERGERLDVEYTDVAPFADEIASYGPDVVVLSPGDLADAVHDRLTAVLEAHSR